MPKLVAAVIVIVAAIARNGRIGTLPAAQHDEPEDREREQREVLVGREARLPLAAAFEHAVQEDVLLGPEHVPHAADTQHARPTASAARWSFSSAVADRAPRDLVRRLVAEEVGVGARDVAELRLEVRRARLAL